MIVNGIDVSKLIHEDPNNYPPMVPGRVVHIDGDFLAYMVSFADVPVEVMKKNLDSKADKIRQAAGAETMVIHLTPKESTKGNRYEQAMVREYQAARKGKIKPRFLHLIRNHMHTEYGAIQHVNCEADDGMSKAQYAAIADGKRNLSIIATKDKDLAMVPGLALNWDTGEITDTTDNFGYIELVPKGKTKKIKGRGWKLLWAQLLTGDAADNISGLPLVCDLKYLPNGKDKQCGPVLAFDMLNPLSTNREAFTLVRDLYRQYGEKHGFFNWRDGTPIRWQDAFLSELKLLWMRRNDNDDDVVEWMKEYCV